MSAIIIFESLVIPAIITFMLVALFIINKEYLFFKKSGISKTSDFQKRKTNDQLNNEKFMDFSGGTWGI